MHTRLTVMLGTALLALPVAAQAQLDHSRQAHEARMADEVRLGMVSPEGWLRQAQEAIRRNRLDQANEALERAETRALAGGATSDVPASLVQHSAAARSALAGRDRGVAMREIGLALQASGTGLRQDMRSGADATGRSAEGGRGTATIRESGPGGSWRSPASTLVQATPGTDQRQGRAPAYGTQGVPPAATGLGTGPQQGGAGAASRPGVGMTAPGGAGMSGSDAAGPGAGRGTTGGTSRPNLGTAPGAGGPMGGSSGGGSN